MNVPRRRKKARLWVGIVLGLLLVFSLVPFLWMAITSIKGDRELYMGRSFFPLHPTLTAYAKLLSRTSFLRYYLNSLLVAGATIPIGLVISIFAAYSLIRLRWRGRRIVRSTVLVTYTMPVVMLAVPFYTVLNSLKMIDTLAGLILAYLTSVVPFCTWFLMGYLEGVPTEVEEGARIDGCGYLAMIARVLVPMIAPGIATAAIYTFVQAWSLYLYPAILIVSTERQLLPVGINQLVSGDMYPWQQIMAAGLLVSLLPVILFMLIQKHVVQGLTAGAVKG